MEKLTLAEYETARGVPLTPEQRDALRHVAPDVTVSPSAGEEGLFDLTPGSSVGALALPDLAVEIRPKILIDRVLFLLSYALDPRNWHHIGFNLEVRDSLLEALIPGFIHKVRQAFRRGLLQGYRSEEDAIPGLKGRFRMEDQIRKRFGIMPPVEVRYDEFTEDIEPNRLILAAVDRLERMRLRSPSSRAALRPIRNALERVALREYPPAQVPEIAYDRLNEHYRGAVELARLILRSASFDLAHGTVRASAFLIDMNKVFESFVHVALREALRLGEQAFPRCARGRGLWLDLARTIRLQPDLSWWEDGACVFVGDAKYKRVAASGIKNSDVYQILAYSISTGLPGGLLIYAAGEGEPVTHEIVEIGKRIEVVTLDLSRRPATILADIEALAQRVRTLRAIASPSVVLRSSPI